MTIFGKWLRGYYSPQAKGIRDGSWKPSISISSSIDELFNTLTSSKEFTNLIKSYTGSGMTDSEKETLDYQQDLKESFYNAHESMPAQVAQAQEAGLNPMTVFGNGASVSSSSAPSAAGSGASGSPLDLLGMLLNFKVEQQKVNIMKEQSDSVIQRNYGNAESGFASAERTRSLVQSEIANLDARTATEKESLENKRVERELMKANISKAQASTLLDVKQTALLAQQEKFGDQYWQNVVQLQQLDAQYEQALISKNQVEIRMIEHQITNLQTANDNMIKEGVKISLESGKLKKEINLLGIDEKYASSEKVVGMVTDGIDSVSGIVSSVTGGAGKLIGGIFSGLNGRRTAGASERRAGAF